MSARVRSWLGAFLILTGVLLVIVAGNYSKTLYGLVWPGIGCLLLGLIVVVFAFRAILRQIGASHSSFEIRLKSEIHSQRDDKSPPPSNL